MGAIDLPHGLTEAHLIAYLREQCEADLGFFARYFYRMINKTPFLFNDHHAGICDDLMAVHRGEIRNLGEHLPPRYSKTELCVVLFVAWCFAKNPQCQFVHLSYSDPLTATNSAKIKAIIKSPEYRQLWPHVEITRNKDSAKAWNTTLGGVFYAAAAGGQVTGFGAGSTNETNPDGSFKFSGCLLIDDPLKPDDARHDTLREAVNDRWESTIRSRRNSRTTPVVLIMQRIHQKDFAAHVYADTSMTWTVRSKQALIDEGKPTERALWPWKHSVDDLKAMRDQRNDRGEVNPKARAVFDSQYQQRPTVAGGGIFQESWWRFYGDRAEAVSRCSRFWITSDTAYTEDEENDPSVICFWGAEGRTRLYLIDRVRGWWEFPTLLKRTREFWEANPRGKDLFVEAKASGLSLIQTLNKQRTDDMRREGFKAKPWGPKQYHYPPDKVGRANTASDHVFKGEVWLPSPEIASWVWEFVDEHSDFTANDSHEHDDQVDNTSMATSIWTRRK